MVRTRTKAGLVGAVVAASSLFMAAPAQAGACHPDPLGPDVSGEEKICQTVLYLTCIPFQELGGCPFA
jgi:hypothetical protein